jgi:outer membrane protein OmpA-like peptidoglycan-associated protein
MRRTSIAVGLGLVLFAFAPRAWAQSADSVGGAASAGGSGSTATRSDNPDAEAESHSGERFGRRYRPTTPGLELGIYGGLHLFPKNHNLQSLVVTSESGHETLEPGGELGLRLGLYPVNFLGGEVEGGLIFSKTGTTDDKAKIWVVRGHGILQLPLGRVVPFVLGGGGLYALETENSIGDDQDPIVYFGGGLKFNCNQRLALRLDVRDNFMQKNKLPPSNAKDGDMVQGLEFLFGLSLTFGRTPWSPNPPDQDRDGVPDREDQCPADAGPAPTGCPPPPDADRDGIPDSSDPCPTEAEDGNPPDEKDGCPNKDLDNDGIAIPVDLCPDQAGIAPDGCPPKDTDGDGLMDPDDRCPKDAETRNNFEDQDGCPDELPEQVKKFTGVIRGIQFASGNAKIRKTSFPLLDDAVSVLKQYPTLRIRISGHTDSRGVRAKNLTLSENRANAVRDYLTTRGIESSRVETRGVGPEEPIADNKTSAGRAQNRRIEFELLPQ